MGTTIGPLHHLLQTSNQNPSAHPDRFTMRSIFAIFALSLTSVAVAMPLAEPRPDVQVPPTDACYNYIKRGTIADMQLYNKRGCIKKRSDEGKQVRVPTQVPCCCRDASCRTKPRSSRTTNRCLLHLYQERNHRRHAGLQQERLYQEEVR